MDCLNDLADIDAINLPELPPLTMLRVRTWNTMYQLVVTEGAHVYVQGGTYFRDFTSAHIDGASMGGGPLKMGWIAVGLLMELHVDGKRIVTSPVVAITAEQPDFVVVH